jgi:hypothetical protein
MSLRLQVTNMNREHNMVRFKDGQPQAVWFSQHDFGEAYTYSAVQKVDKRPVAFSARGSHANYATADAHDLHNFSSSPPLPLHPLPTHQPTNTSQTPTYLHISFLTTPLKDQPGTPHYQQTTTPSQPQPTSSLPQSKTHL